MLLRIFILMICIAYTAFAQAMPSVNQNAVTFRSIGSEYEFTQLDTINAQVVNNSGQKIYSYNLGWGLQLLLYNEETKQWKKTSFGFRCGNGMPGVAESEPPILPNELLLLSINTLAVRGAFYASEITGFVRCKLLFEYAYEPWVRPSDKKLISKTFVVESSEFKLMYPAK